LHGLADRVAERLRMLGVPPDEAVIGIYRSFGRPGRIATRVLRTLLEPVACHELTAASGHRAAGGAAVALPEQLTLVVDISRFPHPQARQIAEDAGVPLLTRPLPAVPPMDSASTDAVERGTRVGRVLTLNSGAIRPTGARESTSRGDTGAHAPRAR
jgi:hypothetical protein